MSSDDSGSAAVAVVGAIGVLLVLVVWLSALAMVMQAHLEATTAADAAALAAAPVTFLPFGAKGSPADEAARFARLNGARLVWCRCPLDQSFETRMVEVRVTRSIDLPVLGVTLIEASGRAEFVPAALLEGLGIED